MGCQAGMFSWAGGWTRWPYIGLRAKGISRPEVHGVLSTGHGEKTVASCSGLGGEGSEARRKWEADGGKELLPVC